MGYWTPAFQNFFTDLSAAPMDNQSKVCGDLEIRALECVEYYGKQRGLAICRDFYDDFQDCRFQTVQQARYNAMQKEYEEAVQEDAWPAWGRQVERARICLQTTPPGMVQEGPTQDLQGSAHPRLFG